MPWPRVAGVLVVLVSLVIAAGSLDGFRSNGFLFVGAAGAVCGLAGAVFGYSRQVPVAVLAAWGAACLMHVPGPAADPRLVALALAILCGFEAWRSGGRAMVVAILATVLLHSASHAPPPWDPASAGVFAAAAVLGFLPVWASGGIGSRAPEPVSPAAARRLTLFLAVGLFLTISLTQTMHRPEAIWLIQMFVFRALIPPRAIYIAHIRFAIGAVLGAVLAGLLAEGVILPLGLSQNHWVTGIIGVLALGLGLRFMPAGNIVTPLALSVAAIMIIAPSASTAVLRGEEALAIGAIAISLTFCLDWMLGGRGTSRPAN